ncbi:hypothetical protein EMCRGX_G005555 [Ephydatia muelleri]
MHRDLGRRQSGHWPGEVAVLPGTLGGDSQGTGQEMWQYSQGPGGAGGPTGRAGGSRAGRGGRLPGTLGGDSQGTGQEMWQYSQGPGEETVRALAMSCGGMRRDLGRRQSGHWPGDVAVLTGTWGGDSQGIGQEMWQYSQGPGVETVTALARRCGSTHRDLGRRQSGHWPGDVAVLTGTLGGDSQGIGQEMWQYSQGPGEETVRALAMSCGSTHRDLGRRQSGHWPGDVAVLTGTWGGDSQGIGQETSQYSQGPGVETVTALARSCGGMHRDLGRRQSGHWPGEVAVLPGTLGGDSQGTGQEMWQYSQGPGEETVRALAMSCGGMRRDLGRRQSGHWPGDVAVLTGTWGGDSQGIGQEMWQYSQGPGVETVTALARRCGSTHRDLGRRQSGHWPGDVAVLTGTLGGDSQGIGQEMWQYSQGPGEETVRALAMSCGSTHRDLGRRQSGHWPGDVAVLTGTWGGDSQGIGQETSQYSQGPGEEMGTGQGRWPYSQGPWEETVGALTRRCGNTHMDLGRRQSGHWPGDVAVLTGTWGGDGQGTGQEMWQYSQGPGEKTVRALARDVAVLTGTWGGDSQGIGQETSQYSQGPGEETVRALARRCGSTHRDLGRRQSGQWPGDVASNGQISSSSTG